MPLSTQQQILIEQRVTNEGKSTGVAYLLWLFTGGFGGHRFYLGRVGSGAAIAVLMVLGLLTSVVGVGVLFLAIAGIWVLVDAFLISGMVAEQKRQLREQLAQAALINPSSDGLLPSQTVTAQNA